MEERLEKFWDFVVEKLGTGKHNLDDLFEFWDEEFTVEEQEARGLTDGTYVDYSDVRDDLKRIVKGGKVKNYCPSDGSARMVGTEILSNGIKIEIGGQNFPGEMVIDEEVLVTKKE